MSTAQKRYAIIIGVDKYENKQIPALDGVTYDVKELCEKLGDPSIGKFEIYKGNYLLGENAKSTDIRQAISDIFWKDNEYDLVFFYFSGHGFKDGYGNGYIAPYDISPNEPFVSGINMSELKQLILRSKNKKAVVAVLDCCYSGIAAKGERGNVGFDPLPVGQFDTGDSSSEGRIIITSGGKDQKSREMYDCTHHDNDIKHTHGKFSYYFLEAINGKAMDTRGVIKLGNIHDYITRNMTEEQRPRAMTEQDYNLRDITIAIAPEKHKQSIEVLEYDIRGYLDSFSSSVLLTVLETAIRKLFLLEDLDQNNKNIAIFENQIDEGLKKYKDNIATNLTRNRGRIEPNTEAFSPGLYQKLFAYTKLMTWRDIVPMIKNDEKMALCCLENLLDLFQVDDGNPLPDDKLADISERLKLCHKSFGKIQNPIDNK
jgi:hypothetical protein